MQYGNVSRLIKCYLTEEDYRTFTALSNESGCSPDKMLARLVKNANENYLAAENQEGL